MSLNIGILSSAYKAAVPSGTLLLDDYPGAAAAYSLRKLRSAYSGSAIRVRRSSDNTETDIGFVAGVLDTATLTTFCGLGNGFVVIWYDQSGNARNLIGTNVFIIVAGILQMFGTKPSLYFAGINQIMSNSSFIISQPNSYFIVNQGTSANNTGTKAINESTSPLGAERNVTYKSSSGFYTMYGGNVLTSSQAYTINKNVISSIFNTTSSYMYFNSSVIVSNQNVGTQSMKGLSIGAYSQTEQNFQGYIPENIIYNSNQFTNRAAIVSNINSFYSIF
jgi:hypothetical protein